MNMLMCHNIFLLSCCFYHLCQWFLTGGARPPGGARTLSQGARVGYRMGGKKNIWKKKKKITKIPFTLKCKWLDYYNTQTNHPSGDFFCQKRLPTNLATFTGVIGNFCGVFGDSDLKARITPQLLCSTSSRCCCESLPRPKALTGGQSLSSLAQQSSLQSEQRGDTQQSASRMYAGSNSFIYFFQIKKEDVSTDTACFFARTPTAMNQLWGGPACKRLRTPDLCNILLLYIYMDLVFLSNIRCSAMLFFSLVPFVTCPFYTATPYYLRSGGSPILRR